jgi:predicted urease superfamily metal-dependent hydrolase
LVSYNLIALHSNVLEYVGYPGKKDSSLKILCDDEQFQDLILKELSQFVLENGLNPYEIIKHALYEPCEDSYIIQETRRNVNKVL